MANGRQGEKQRRKESKVPEVGPTDEKGRENGVFRQRTHPTQNTNAKGGKRCREKK